MPFQEIVAPSIRELFVQQLTGLILSGELRPGDRLPTERELADEMKISKTVVHEGIRELRRQGFLDVSSRRGVTVADYAQTGSLETLMAIMDYHGGLPDRKTACSILELRDYLEAPAMEHLAAHHTEADLAALRALQQQAEEASVRGGGGVCRGTAALSPRHHVFKRQHDYAAHLQRLPQGEPRVLAGVYPRRGHGALSRDAPPVHGLYRARRGPRRG